MKTCCTPFSSHNFHFVTGESIVEYLVAVFTDLLHSQTDPLPLCLMLQLYDKELQSSAMSSYSQLCQFSHYYSLWIPQQAKEILVSKAENMLNCMIWCHTYPKCAVNWFGCSFWFSVLSASSGDIGQLPCNYLSGQAQPSGRYVQPPPKPPRHD